MKNKIYFKHRSIICLILLSSMIGLASCQPQITTQGGVLPTPVQTNTPQVITTAFQEITEQVPVLAEEDSIVHQNIDLALFAADYFSMPQYLPESSFSNGHPLRNDKNVFPVACTIDNTNYLGVYGLTENGMLLNSPKVIKLKVDINGQIINIWDAYVKVEDKLYSASLFDHNPYEEEGKVVQWTTIPGNDDVVGIVHAYIKNNEEKLITYPIILNSESGEIWDFVRDIAPEVADECISFGYKSVAIIENKILFYTEDISSNKKFYYLNLEEKNISTITVPQALENGDTIEKVTAGNKLIVICKNGPDEKYYYWNLASEKLVELEVPLDAQGALKSTNCMVVETYGDSIVFVRELSKTSTKYRDYYLCDATQGKIIVLEKILGENLSGCSRVGEQLVCAGENNYWSLNLISLEKKKILETKDVVLGFDEPHQNNASFVIIRNQDKYQIYDFFKENISNLDALGRWAELESVNYIVSPDGRKMIVYGGTKNGLFQLGFLDCDLNTFTDIYREGTTGIKEETMIWWISNSAIAIASEDMQSVRVYTGK